LSIPRDPPSSRAHRGHRLTPLPECSTTRAQGLDEESITDPFAFGTARVMISLGFACFVAGFAYRQLPIDLIPDFIPVIGGMDDMVAGMIAGVGIALMYLGWHFGTGEKPVEILIAAHAVGTAKLALYPLKLAAVAAFKAGVAASKPLVALAVATYWPYVESAFTKVRTLFYRLVEKLVGKAFEEYVNRLQQANPALSLVKKFVK
jgi:hypothetical protein